MLDDADEVILIDLSPEGARARLQHGHIYPPEQARLALERFFRPENLAALRELALKRTAQDVDERLEDMMREASRPSGQKLLVLIDEKPESRTLIREAWSLAEALHAELLVGYVDRELPDQERRDFAKTLELAEDLNGRLIGLTLPNASDIARFVADQGITHVLLTNERSSLLGRLLGNTLTDQLARIAPHVRIHLVS